MPAYVVAGKHNECVCIHPLVLQRLGDVPDARVQAVGHAFVRLPEWEIDSLVREFIGHLIGCVCSGRMRTDKVNEV